MIAAREARTGLDPARARFDGLAQGRLWTTAAWLAAVAAAATALFLWHAASLPFVDPDEGRYAEIAREMLGSGDWIIPRLYGVAYLEKPPLLYWLVAASFDTFGAHELAARLVPALCSGLGVAVTAGVARVVFGARVGLLAAVLLSTTALYFVFGRTVITDVPFALFLTAALSAYLLVELRRLPRVLGYAVFWIALALATLAKGPAALVIAVAVVTLYSLSVSSPRRLGDGVLLALFPAYLLVAVPWFLVAQSAYPNFLEFYLWKEHIARAAGAEHREPFWFYIPWVVLGMMPWTFRALGALWHHPSAWRPAGEEGRAAAFLAIWALVVLVLFSAAGGKLGTYVLPLFAPLAVLVARVLDAASRAAPRGGSTCGAEGEAALYAILALSVLVVEAWCPRCLSPPAAVSIAGVASLAAVLVFANRAAPLPRSIAASLLGVVVVYGVLLNAAPEILDDLTASPHIRRLREILGPGDEIVLYRAHTPSLAFYTGRYPYLVNCWGEMAFGAGDRTGGRFWDDLQQLGAATGDSTRIFCLTVPHRLHLSEIRRTFPRARVLDRNLGSALLLLQAGEPAGGSGTASSDETIDR